MPVLRFWSDDIKKTLRRKEKMKEQELKLKVYRLVLAQEVNFAPKARHIVRYA